jgi:hypothetical protein
MRYTTLWMLSSGFIRCVLLEVLTNASEEPTAFIFINSEDGGSRFLRKVA